MTDSRGEPSEPGRRWWQHAWAWGVTVSIALGAFGAAAGDSSKWQLAILLSFAGLILTALIEVLLQIEDAQAAVHKGEQSVGALNSSMSVVSPLLTAPKAFQQFIRDVEQSRRRCERDGHAFFQSIFNKLQREFEEMAELVAGGHIQIDANAPYSFRSAPLANFHNMRMVHVRGLDYWSTRPGISYLERQRQAISKGGLSIERIFVLSSKELDKARSVMAAQVSAGIQVRIVICDFPVANDLAKCIIDQGLVEDASGAQMLVRPEPGGSDQGIVNAERETLSHRGGDIDSATRQIEKLATYSITVAEAFPDLAT